MNKEQLISEMLLLPAAAMDYHISQHLLELFPGKTLIESEGYLNVEGYAEAKYCTLTRQTFTYNQRHEASVKNSGLLEHGQTHSWGCPPVLPRYSPCAVPVFASVMRAGCVFRLERSAMTRTPFP